MIDLGDEILVRDLPIFDEHQDDSRPDGFKVVDRPFLERILQANLPKINDGERLPFVIDHVGTSNQNPPILAFGHGMKIGEIGTGANRRSAIMTDMHCPKHNWSEVQKYPRRSIEIDPRSLDLDPIALLGGKSPSRYLGGLNYSKKPGERIRYEMETTMDLAAPAPPAAPAAPAAPNPMVAEIIAGLTAALGPALREALTQVLDEEAPTDDKPDESPLPAQTPAEEANKPETEGNMDKPDSKYARMQAEQYAARDKRLEEQNKALASRIEQLEKDRAASAVEAELVKMEADEGIIFERAKEHAYLMTLPSDAARKMQYERMRENYKRDPTAVPRLNVVHGAPVYGDEAIPTEKIAAEAAEAKVLQYCRAHGVEWDVAVQKVFGTKSA